MRVRKFALIVSIAALVLVLITAFVACNKDENKDNGKLTITYDLNYDGAPQPATVSVDRESYVTGVETTRTGYDFSEWTFDRAGRERVTSSSALRNHSTLYAQWVKKEYTVRFFVGDAQIGEPQKVKYQEAATAPELAEFWSLISENHSGKAFDGWNKSFDKIEADTDVKAELVDRTATVYFFNGEKLFAEYGGLDGKKVPAPPVIRRDGFDFAGWFTSEGDEFVEGETTYSSDITYLAKWDIAGISEIEISAGEQIVESYETGYGDDVTLTGAVQTYEGISYAYQWYVDEAENSAEATISLKAIAAGEHELKLKVTASAEGSEDVYAERIINLVVNPAAATIETSKDIIELDYTATAHSGFVSETDARIVTEYEGDKELKYTINGEEIDNSFSLTTGGTYEMIISLKNEKNYVAQKTVIIKIKAASLGGVNYTLEDAIAKGGEITLFGDAILSGTHTLKKGSHLILPYDGADDRTHITGDAVYDGKNQYYIDLLDGEPYLKRTLTLKSGSALNIEGKISVGGLTGPSMLEGFQGATLGDYAKMIVESDSVININNGGMIDCYGYIKGDGKMSVNDGGEMYTLYVVRDFRGGSSTTGAYFGGVCPFNQFETPNVQIEHTIYKGATVHAHAQLYASSQVNRTESVVVGEAGAIIINDGYITVKNTTEFHSDIPATPATLYQRYVAKTYITMNGDIAVGALQMELTGVAKVNTATVRFSIPYNYDITLQSGTLTLDKMCKLLPGSSVTIARGATLNIEKNKLYNCELIIYDGNWTDSTHAATAIYPAKLPAAKLTIMGTMNVKSGAAIAGEVTRSGGEVNIASGVITSLNAKEGYGPNMFSFQPTYDQHYEYSLVEG